VLEFHVASLYQCVTAWKRRGWIEGRWLRKKRATAGRPTFTNDRRGRKALPEQRKSWREFIAQSSE